MAPIGKLGGVTVIGASNADWPTRAGVQPVSGTFDVTPQGLETLLPKIASNETVDYVVDGQTISGLLVLRQEAGPNPHVKRVLVADRRVLWPFRHLVFDFNILRRVGTKRRGQWQEQLQQDVVGALQFRIPTLKDGFEPFRAQEVLAIILETLGESGVTFEPDVGILDALPVENLRIDDSGDSAIRKALSYLPGAEIVLEAGGGLRVFNRLSGGENPAVLQSGQEAVGGGHVEFVREDLLRPRAVDVLFEVEAELRFDYVDDEPLSFDFLNPPLRVENVVQVPDFGPILIDGLPTYQGTFVNLGAYRRQINLEPGLLKGRITDLLLRQAMVSETGLWQALQLAGEVSLDAEKQEWAARFSALRRDYRTLFRILPQWVDRIKSIRSYLVATIDLVSGQRAPALALGDHAIRPSAKGRLLVAHDTGGRAWLFNVDGYPGLDLEPTEKKNPSPASVQIVDQDQGIMRVVYKLSPYGLVEEILPSQVTEDTLPTRNLRKSSLITGQPLSTNAVIADQLPASLKKEMRLAIFVTCIPAAPNSTKRLYRIRVTPNEVADLLPPAALVGLNEANGPVQEVRIPGQIETARIRWQTTEADRIKRLFGVGGDPPAREDLQDLVINDGQAGGDLRGAASLPSIARAAAAAVYARRHARYRGTKTVDRNLGIKVDGAVAAVVHRLGTNGTKLSTIVLAPDVTALDLFAFLDDGTRQVVLQQVQGPQAVGG